MGLLEANALPNGQQLFTTSFRILSEDAVRSLACVSITQLSLLTLVPRSLPLSQQALPTFLWISDTLSACHWRGFNPTTCYTRLTGRLCCLVKGSTFQGQKNHPRLGHPPHCRDYLEVSVQRVCPNTNQFLASTQDILRWGPRERNVLLSNSDF